MATISADITISTAAEAVLAGADGGGGGRIEAAGPADARRHGGGGLVLRLQTRCVLDVFVFVGRSVLRVVVESVGCRRPSVADGGCRRPSGLDDGLELIGGIALGDRFGLVRVPRPRPGLGSAASSGSIRPSRRTGWAERSAPSARGRRHRRPAGHRVLVDHVDVEVVRLGLLGHGGDDDHRPGAAAGGGTGSASSMSSNSSASGRQSGSCRCPVAGPPRFIRRDLAPLLRTRVARATSLVRRTVSRLLMSMGTRTNSQSTTRRIQSNDWGCLACGLLAFPSRLGP